MVGTGIEGCWNMKKSGGNWKKRRDCKMGIKWWELERKKGTYRRLNHD